MNNQTMLEHIMAICEEYKHSVYLRTQTLSMLAGGCADAKEIAKAQNNAIDMFEAEAFVAVTRIKAFLDKDGLKIDTTCTQNEEAIKKFIEENKK